MGFQTGGGPTFFSGKVLIVSRTRSGMLLHGESLYYARKEEQGELGQHTKNKQNPGKIRRVLKPAKSKRGREEGDGTENVNKLS